MPGGDLAKGHRWTDGDPGAGAGAPHHARRIVADGCSSGAMPRIGKLVGGAVEALVGVGVALELQIFAAARRGIENAPHLVEPLGVAAEASASACGLSPRLM